VPVKSLIIDPATGLLAEVTNKLDPSGHRLKVDALLVGFDPNGNLVAIQFDEFGRLIAAPPSASSTNAGFALGDVNTSATGLVIVRRTTYTEPSSVALRSVKSSSALDTAAGTGARTIKITYYTAAFAGPFTEDITLNGTTAVDADSDIYYVDEIRTLTAGSGGTNAGTITLYAAAGGLGAVIGTIGVGDGQTFWCHRYVPVGKTAHITAQWAGHNGTVVGSGGTFLVKSKQLNVSGSVWNQISDSFRLYGQSSSVQRNYGTPLRVVGPAIVATYTNPETSSTINYRASFDFYMD